jgi:isoquinoline 1-oxidoreductase subunit beta
MIAIRKVNRRDFLRAGLTGAAGLTLGFGQTSSSPFRLNAWIHIGSDDSVTFFIHKAEMGQGTITSLSMLLAEELECDWKKVRTAFPGVDRAFGGNQGVVGSASIRGSYASLRKSGAAARDMLIQAAARRWSVEPAALRAENGAVVNPASNARLSFGSLAEAASKLPVPVNPSMKDARQFHLIGTPVKRLDTPDKVNGRTVFGIDSRVPGMLYGVVARCPVFGGKLASFDDTKARAVPGVRKVVQVSTGVAVVADNTWAAIEGRRALSIQWDEGPDASLNSAGISRLLAEGAQAPGGAVARKVGDADATLAGAVRKIEAVYEAPYLAHSPMEPLSCTAVVRPDSCEVWASTQMQTSAQNIAARAAGVKPENVQVHTLMLGGGFGRRANTDYVGEAVEVAKAIDAPVKLTWTRDDDLQHDRYRTASVARFTGALDADGWPLAWKTSVCCESISRSATDGAATEGIRDIEYAIPNILVNYHMADLPIPVFYWRSVGYSQNTFFTESFLDELAASTGKDPVEFRRRLLANAPKLLGALNLVAVKSGWGAPLPPGRSRGVALVNNIGSATAEVAEVSVARDGKVRVHRVVAAVDCGVVVNPAIVEQQIRSGIVYGLTAALKGEITIARGRVTQENFHQYDALRIDEMPVIDVHIVASDRPPSGIGEASVPPIAPAVCNAIFAATGKRIRKLPIRPEQLV